MNSFGFSNNMCYQFWMLPNIYGTQPTFYNPMTFYPQMARPISSNLLFQTIPTNPSYILPIQ